MNTDKSICGDQTGPHLQWTGFSETTGAAQGAGQPSCLVTGFGLGKSVFYPCPSVVENNFNCMVPVQLPNLKSLQNKGTTEA